MQILGIILTHSLAEVTLLQGEPVIRLQTLTLLASLKNAACLKVSCYNESSLCCLPNIFFITAVVPSSLMKMLITNSCLPRHDVGHVTSPGPISLLLSALVIAPRMGS